MRIVNLGTIAACAAILLPGPLAAAEMTGGEIKALISGNTAYVETTGASVTGAVGKGTIYYAADGTGLYKTPKGETWHGTWAIKGNLLCTEWKEGPKRPCLKYDKQGDIINVNDSESGQTRVRVTKFAPGNAENLKP
jgi:hypothetical protein